MADSIRWTFGIIGILIGTIAAVSLSERYVETNLTGVAEAILANYRILTDAIRALADQYILSRFGGYSLKGWVIDCVAIWSLMMAGNYRIARFGLRANDKKRKYSRVLHLVAPFLYPYSLFIYSNRLLFLSFQMIKYRILGRPRNYAPEVWHFIKREAHQEIVANARDLGILTAPFIGAALFFTFGNIPAT